jgi:ketosteroid isomerase-like protein
MMNRQQRMGIAAAALVAMAPSAVSARGPQSQATAAAPLDAAAREPAAVVDAFHAALGRGDVAQALARMADDAIIFESGGAERSKAEYAAHHAPADAAYAQAVPGRTLRRTGRVVGDTALILSEGRMTGTYKGRPVDRLSKETMLLLRAGGTWRIAHIHWSSAPAPTSVPAQERE